MGNRNELGQFKKGFASSFKGKKFSEESRKKLSESHKGHIVLEETKMKLKKAFTGKNNKTWKGSFVGYSALHHWVNRQLGKAIECVYCGKEKWQGRIEWASVSHKAKRDLDDYISLCVSCHRGYDKEGRMLLCH